MNKKELNQLEADIDRFYGYLNSAIWVCSQLPYSEEKLIATGKISEARYFIRQLEKRVHEQFEEESRKEWEKEHKKNVLSYRGL